MKRLERCIVLFVLLTIGVRVKGASIEIFPADLRKDRTVYNIGGEINPIHFIIYSNRACGGKQGIHVLKGFEENIGSSKIKFTVDIPKELEYFGMIDMGDDFFDKEDEASPIMVNGKSYIRHSIYLKNDVLKSRVVNGKHRYDIYLWLKFPETYSGTLSWGLLKDGQKILTATNRLETVGTISAKVHAPKHFKFFMTYSERNLPKELVDKRIQLYKKMGITHIAFNYGLSGYSDSAIKLIKKLRKAGIKVVAQRSGSFSGCLKKLHHAIKSQKGLVSAAEDAYKKLNSKEERRAFKSIKKYVDGFVFDYEYPGAMSHPGFKDKETIAAFCKANRLKKVKTKDLKTKYREKYFAFRNKLVCKPIEALAALLKKEKRGTPLFVEQGSGYPVGSKLDPRIYDKFVAYNDPMIYTDPLSFYKRTKSTAKHFGYKKLFPTTCAGFTDSSNKILSRGVSGWLLLDYMGAATLNLPGIKHWPGIRYFDGGQLYEFVRAATLLSKVELYYQKGKSSKRVRAYGVPYRVKKIKLAKKTLDLSKPQWSKVLVISAKERKKKTLVTILNYHASQDAFVKIRRSGKKDCYLRNVETGAYLALNGDIKIPAKVMKKGVMVKVPKRDLALWIVTLSAPKGAYKTVETGGVVKEFEERKIAFNKNAPEIQLGRKGDITVSYENVKSQVGDDVCLEVITPKQKVYIKSSGGIIWKWDVNGKDLILKNDGKDGAGMDLLWVPASARWGGDELNEMTLTKCVNDGKKVTLTFEQELQASVANVKLQKVYQIPVDKPEIKVSVTFTNGTEQPITLGYWSHNIFGNVPAASRVFMIAKGKDIEVNEYGTRKAGVYSNPANVTGFVKLLIRKPAHVDSLNCFGEYFKKDKCGVILTVPNDFLQIYRWTGAGKGSLEWMGSPKKIATGDSFTEVFTMKAVRANTEEVFKQAIEKTVK